MITTNARDLTEQQIRTLRAEAGQAGDHVQVAICDLALCGSFDGDDYGVLSQSEIRRVSAMSRQDAYAAIVEALTR